MNQRPAIDPQKLKHDADELAALAESVPSEVDQTTKGLLPKDLSGKLKRIEKLAKQLRSQIAPRSRDLERESRRPENKKPLPRRAVA